MNRVVRFFSYGVCLSLLIAPAACVVPEPGPPAGAVPGDNVVYRPKALPGQTGEMVNQTLLDELKAPAFGSRSFIMDPAYPKTWIVIQGCTLHVGRFTLQTNYIAHNQKVEPTIYLYQLFQPTLAVENNHDKTNAYSIAYQIRLANSFRLGFESLSTAQKVADALYFIRQALWRIEEQRKEKLALFEPKAAEYRALKIKPPMSEELRRMVVQANLMSEQKKYAEAIKQYSSIIEIEPISYPAAYFNLALLLAQDKKPLSAIYNMKHYLLLVPNAPDARGAQDKIYEWEYMLK
ncbi:MAG: hypothetical protein C4576_29380 [Desulfobacteraceae bacterium]|nr:MAG: hypothetical protein C4576_29380 [Desulfobacteraceae bacterium]